MLINRVKKRLEIIYTGIRDIRQIEAGLELSTAILAYDMCDAIDRLEYKCRYKRPNSGMAKG